MKKYKLTVKGTVWYFFKEMATGWVVLKYMKPEGGLSRTQIKAIDIGSCLQYIHSLHNGHCDVLSEEDVEEIEEIQFK